MQNMHKETQTPSTPDTVVPTPIPKRLEVENTLNYLNATHSLLDNGLFIGKDHNVLIQVKAWIENQQKTLQLQLAKAIASDAAQEGK